jgi:gas vesicle protein
MLSRTSTSLRREGILVRERGTVFVVGLVLGVVVGAALMGLFAPAEGEQTRQQLFKQGDALRRRALETAEDVSEQVQERVQGVVALTSRPFAKKRKRGLARLRFWEDR